MEWESQANGSTTVRIIAIDPGPTKSAMLELFSSQHGTHDSNFFASVWLEENELILQRLVFYEREKVHLAIEDMQWYGPNMTAGQSTFETCKWIGRFIQAWEPGEVTMVYRTAVKAHICGLAKAKDPQVRQCLIDRWGEPGKKKDPNPVTYGIKADLWSALAIATWYLDAMIKGKS